MDISYSNLAKLNLAKIFPVIKGVSTKLSTQIVNNF